MLQMGNCRFEPGDDLVTPRPVPDLRPLPVHHVEHVDHLIDMRGNPSQLDRVAQLEQRAGDDVKQSRPVVGEDINDRPGRRRLDIDNDAGGMIGDRLGTSR